MKRISIIITIILQTLWPISAISQWAQTNGPYGGTVNALFVNSGRLFAGTTGGVYLSTNGGSSWSPASAGLTTGDTKAFTINGSNIFAGTNGGGSLPVNR
ncbi:MAG: hypothetical protein JST46_13385 [Bacteroidetes bacterium]|nr:hypothetical protein [Bacteroidota bacterium]